MEESKERLSMSIHVEYMEDSILRTKGQLNILDQIILSI